MDPVTFDTYEEWHKAALDAGYTIRGVQGRSRFEALDGATVVGTWSETSGTLPSQIEQKAAESPANETSGDVT